MWAHSGIRGAADGVLADLEANGILSTLLEGDKPSQNSPEQQAVSRQAPYPPFLATTGLRTAASIRSREYDNQPLAYAGCSVGSQIVMYSSCAQDRLICTVRWHHLFQKRSHKAVSWALVVMQNEGSSYMTIFHSQGY